MADYNDQAFPTNEVTNDGCGGNKTYTYFGLTKREYFAVKALQGILANNDGVNRVWAKARETNHSAMLAGEAAERCLASNAVHIADALIKELDK